MRQTHRRRLAGARHHRDRDPHRLRRGPRRRRGPRPRLRQQHHHPPSAPAGPRPNAEPRREHALATHTRRPHVRANPALGRWRRRRTLAAAGWVALPRQARRRANVLRRAARRAPPGAASRTAALAIERAGRARRRHADATARFTIHTRARADHFLPGGATGTPGWLEALLALAATHADRGEELFIAPAVRSHPRGDKHAVAHTRALWVDIDQPGQLHHLWAFLAERPCHLLVESGGGGVHSYWLLDEPLPATDAGPTRGLLETDRTRAPAADPPPRRRSSTGKPNVADSPARTAAG